MLGVEPTITHSGKVRGADAPAGVEEGASAVAVALAGDAAEGGEGDGRAEAHPRRLALGAERAEGVVGVEAERGEELGEGARAQPEVDVEDGEHGGLDVAHGAVGAEALAVADADGVRGAGEGAPVRGDVDEGAGDDHRAEARAEAVLVDADAEPGGLGAHRAGS